MGKQKKLAHKVLRSSDQGNNGKKVLQQKFCSHNPNQRQIGQLLSLQPLEVRKELIANRPKNPKKVIVVGSGFAGLSNALELFYSGYDVTVLEAKSRPGGRVKSYKDPSWASTPKGHAFELGAELIGSKDVHSLWHAYKDRLGLNLYKIDEEEKKEPTSYTFSSVGEVPKELMEQIEKYQEQFFGQLADDMEGLDLAAPWEWSKAKQFDTISLEDKIEEFTSAHVPSELKMYVKESLKANFLHDNAVPASQQSYMFNICNIKGGGGYQFLNKYEMYRCEGGNQSLANAIAEELLSYGQNIFYNKKVVGIKKKKAGGVRVTATDVQVNKNNGLMTVVERFTPLIYQADYVVLAAPVSIYKDIEFMIDEEFDKTLASIDHNIQMGKLFKMLIPVQSRFWESQKGEGTDLTTLDDIYGEWWETTLHNAEKPVMAVYSYPRFKNLLNIQMFEKVVHTISSVYPDFKNSLRYHEKMVQVWDYETRDLISKKAIDPIYIYKDWYRDINIKGGFSAPRVGGIIELKDTFMKVHSDCLVFAGEHTVIGFTGFMEGALLSGGRSAIALHAHVASKEKVAVAQGQEAIIAIPEKLLITTTIAPVEAELPAPSVASTLVTVGSDLSGRAER